MKRHDGRAVGISVGGRQRGPRDDRFDFTVTARDGAVLPRIDAYNFGGPMGYRAIEPGATALLGSVDLSKWVKIASPGLYRARCSYEAELVHGTEHPAWPLRATEVWDAVFTDEIDIEVSGAVSPFR